MSVHFITQITLMEFKIVLIAGLLDTSNLCDHGLILGISIMNVSQMSPDNQKRLVCQLAGIGGREGGSQETIQKRDQEAAQKLFILKSEKAKKNTSSKNCGSELDGGSQNCRITSVQIDFQGHLFIEVYNERMLFQHLWPHFGDARHQSHGTLIGAQNF